MSSAPRGLVVLDRDGTLVDFHRDVELGIVTPAFHPGHVRFLPGAIDGMKMLAAAGFRLGIATNQPGAAKGELPRNAILATMAAIVDRLRDEKIEVDFEVCLHHPTGGERGDSTLVCDCECRKPRPGMLLALFDRSGVTERTRAWMVGDTAVDLQAGEAASMRTALVTPTRRCELCPLKEVSLSTGDGGAHKRSLFGMKPAIHAPTLVEVAREILALTP